MAGFSFGKSRWDDIPRTLGLTACEDGYLRGVWRGRRVDAHFANPYDQHRDTYYHYTYVGLWFDPPLGVQGLDGGVLFDRIVEPELVAQFQTRAATLGLANVVFSDLGIDARWSSYQSDPERYRAAFELMAWAADIVMDRRAKHPPPWEIEIGRAWPALAKGWGLELDPRAGTMRGTVRGLSTSAAVINRAGSLLTCVDVAVPVSAGCTMSLTRQDGGDGFFRKLFRGQDIVIGYPAFDAAFVIKGEPEAFVRSTLTPAACDQILGIASAGCSITLEDGVLKAMTMRLLTTHEHLDGLMKAAYGAALALLPAQVQSPPQTPYR